MRDNLIPQQKPDKNGKLTTRWVKNGTEGTNVANLPAPALDGTHGAVRKSLEPQKGATVGSSLNPLKRVQSWRKRRAELRNADQHLYDVIAQHPAFRGEPPEGIWLNMSKLSRETKLQARDFINNHSATHPDIALDTHRLMGKYFDVATRLLIVMRNFDHAVELGWRYSPNAFTFILESIDEVRESSFNDRHKDFTPEQEAALLILGDSQWDKDSDYGYCHMRRSYTASEAVAQAVTERPQDVSAIIEIARTSNVTHAAHLDAVLDGEITSVLGEGAL